MADTDADQRPLVEGVDYTVEDGRYVFTAAYLRRRGRCCESGCRHCPYRGTGVPPVSRVPGATDGTPPVP